MSIIAKKYINEIQYQIVDINSKTTSLESVANTKQDTITNLIDDGFLTIGNGLSAVKSGINTTISKYNNLHIMGKTAVGVAGASNTEHLVIFNVEKRTNSNIYNQVGSSINILVAGAYQITCQITLQRTTYSGSGQLRLRPLKNGSWESTLSTQAFQHIHGSTDFTTISIFKNFITFAVNDVLTIGLTNTSGELTGWNILDSVLFIESFNIVP